MPLDTGFPRKPCAGKRFCAWPAKRTWTFLVFALILAASGIRAGAASAADSQAAGILAKMEAAYAKVDSYQAEMEVRDYRKGSYLESKRFHYTFRKPNQLRIDMHSPQPGTVLIYPDRGGKVALRPGGWTGFVTLHLAPDNAMLASGSGQRIDQSDFGLLLRNIRHSLTDQRRGAIVLSESQGRVCIEVLAEDHFVAGVQTLYRFVVDPVRWLPQEVHELTPNGAPKRVSLFRNLKTSLPIPDSSFRIEETN